MPTHSPSLTIGVIVHSRKSEILDSATVTLTLGNESITGTTNSKGQVILNAANLTSGYTSGDVATLKATKTEEGEISQSITLDQPQQVTLTLAETSDLYYFDDGSNSHVLNFVLLTDYAGNKITNSNRLPVSSETVLNEPAMTVTYDTKNRVSTQTITVDGINYTRTFTYTGDGFQFTARTGWIKRQ